MYYVLFRNGKYRGRYNEQVNINNAYHMNKKAIINIYWQAIIDGGYSIFKIEPSGNKIRVELTELAQEFAEEERTLLQPSVSIEWLPVVSSTRRFYNAYVDFEHMVHDWET